MDCLVIHKDIQGEHDTSEMGNDCWCEPLIIEDGSLLTTEQIMEIDRIRNLKQ